MNISLSARFWRHVRKTQRCWLWTGAKLHCGYGSFAYKHHQTKRAHRVAWELSGRSLKRGQFLLHSCDTPACVRPDHLRIGTAKENIMDAVERGRCLRRDGTHYNSKLTRAELRDVRKRLHAGEMGTQIARSYGLSKHTIYCIKSGKTHKQAA